MNYKLELKRALGGLSMNYKLELKRALKEGIIKKLPFDLSKIGRRLGSGAEGTVYTYDSDKVIKLMDEVWTNCHGSPVSTRRFNHIMKKLKDNPSKMYAKVYDYGQITYTAGPFKTKLRYYIIERLSKRCTIRVNRKLWSRRARLLKQSGLFYGDSHGENIMIDAQGNEKLIDLTSFCWTQQSAYHLPLSHKEE